MVFSSHLFLYYFLPAALLLYYLLPRRGRHLGLTLASYLFYGWGNPAFMVLMLFSTVVDYLCGRSIGREAARPDGGRQARRRAAVVVSVITNLSLLGFFKYFNFAVGSYQALIAAAGLDGWQLDTTLRVTLPLGISFYTFQSMSYTIDVYRGRAAPLRSFIDFACYVSMFPQLVAGPIIRFSEIAEQLQSRRHTASKLARGIAIFALGMGKKVLLANPCGRVADAAFDAGSVMALDAWYGLTAYAFQIYFDFSGYSDMAIGLGLMLGFVFPKNFDSPYKAESLTDFWRRWHISLSSWLRDYLYIPLGGSRRGTRRTYVNLGLVMLLGGLWHGAAWSFVCWGALHGVGLAIERALGGVAAWHRLPRPVRVASTFGTVLVAWVFFRADDLAAAVRYLGAMLGATAPAPAASLVGGLVYKPYYLLTVTAAATVAFAAPQSSEWTRRLSWPRGLLCLGVFGLAAVALATQGHNPFIYFIF